MGPQQLALPPSLCFAVTSWGSLMADATGPHSGSGWGSSLAWLPALASSKSPRGWGGAGQVGSAGNTPIPWEVLANNHVTTCWRSPLGRLGTGFPSSLSPSPFIAGRNSSPWGPPTLGLQSRGRGSADTARPEDTSGCWSLSSPPAPPTLAEQTQSSRRGQRSQRNGGGPWRSPVHLGGRCTWFRVHEVPADRHTGTEPASWANPARCPRRPAKGGPRFQSRHAPQCPRPRVPHRGGPGPHTEPGATRRLLFPATECCGALACGRHGCYQRSGQKQTSVRLRGLVWGPEPGSCLLGVGAKHPECLRGTAFRPSEWKAASHWGEGGPSASAGV